MRLESVAFRYNRRGPWVLRDISLSLPRGHITEVTGRNGAGKSTLLRVLAGLRGPTRGTIVGRPASVGYAPERFPTDQPFTVDAYLSHMAAMRGVPSSNIAAWTERLGLSHLRGTKLAELSKGSAQKVGLAQALLANPEILILDEPFAGLDATTRDVLPVLITELADNGTTIVVSDHQRCIEALPGVSHIRVAEGTAFLVPSQPKATSRPLTTPPNAVQTHEATTRPQQAPQAKASTHRQEPSTKHSAPLKPETSQGRASECSSESPANPVTRQDEASPSPNGRIVVLEVMVGAHEVEELEARLRTDGYRVRRQA
ncbi:ATP-binding cassette domain-containing protein [Spirillospora sp. CA-294931]|uniref:ATP-binding cassette domain-containing protein n=1 Tax=Spirillospora sp. CA-294931 TaxID=3240042 RepID=UPI003D8FCDC0